MIEIVDRMVVTMRRMFSFVLSYAVLRVLG